jgi:hypothetical protein
MQCPRPRPVVAAAILTAAVLAAAPLAAQNSDPQQKMTPEEQAMMEAYAKAGTPGPEHAHLASIVGTYDTIVTGFTPDGKVSEKTKGTAERMMVLNGRVLVEKFHGEMMGAPFEGHGMHGFDNVTKKYWSTWNDSMSTGLMLSEGTCDASHACSYIGTYTDAVTGKPKQLRMTTSRSGDAETFNMFDKGPDGKEFKMMEIIYTKRK